MARHWILALSLLLALAVGMGFLWLDRDARGTQLSPGAEPTATAESEVLEMVKVEAGAALSHGRSALAEASVAPQQASAPIETQTEFDYEPELENGIPIRILKAEDRSPVAGAHVIFMLPEAATSEELMAWQTGALSLDEFMGAYGRHFRSNEAGIVKIPNTTSFGLLAASKGELYGLTQYNEAPQGVQELLLRYDPAARIRVLDAAGNALGGVPVFLRSVNFDGWRQDHIGVQSAPQTGLASLEHMLTLMEEIEMWGPPYAAAKILSPSPIEVRIPTDPFPKEPLELVLPAFGSLQLRLFQPDGQPFEGSFLAAASIRVPEGASEAGNSPLHDEMVQAIGKHGHASFGQVALGLQLDVYIMPRSDYAERFEIVAGPTLQGETIEHAIYFEAQVPMLSGQLLDAELLPIALESCEVSFSHAGRRFDSANFRTDFEGRFRFVFPLREEQPLPIDFEFIQQLGGLQRSASQRWLEAPRPGPNELGRIQLEAPPRLAAGRVLSEDGTPIAGAEVILTGSRSHLSIGIGSGKQSYSTQTDGRGAFTILGTPPAGELTLRASHGWHSSSGRIPIRAESEGHEIILERAGVLRGQLLLAEGVDPRSLEVQVKAPAQTWDTAPSEYLDQKGRFGFHSLAPGTYEIVAQLLEGQACKSEVLLVDIVASPEQQIEKITIDMRSDLRSLRIQLVDSEMNPVEGMLTSMRAGQDPANSSQSNPGSHYAHLGTALIPTCQPSLDLEVMADGYRTQRLSGIAEDRVVQLLPGLEVELQTQALPEFPAEVSVLVRFGLLGTSPEERRDQDLRFEVEKDGTTRLKLPEPGHYQVFLEVKRSTDDWSYKTLYNSPEPILECIVREQAAVQVFTFDLPEQALAALR